MSIHKIVLFLCVLCFCQVARSDQYICYSPASCGVSSGGGSIGNAVTGGTAGSILFVDGSGNLAQNNANLFFDTANLQLEMGLGSAAHPSYSFKTGNGTGMWAPTTTSLALSTNGVEAARILSSGNFGIGTTSAGAQLEVDSSAIGTRTIISKNFASQTANNFEARSSGGTPYVTIGPDTLTGSSATSNFFNVTGTLPATTTAQTNGVNVSVGSAGTASQKQVAGLFTLTAGYTGVSSTAAIMAVNQAAGTNVNQNAANYGLTSTAAIITTGDNIGVYGTAGGSSTLNAGLFARTTSGGGSVNVGVYSQATAPGGGTGTAGYFELGSANNSFGALITAALIANNGAVAAPSFVAKNNGTEVFRVDNGGNVGVGTSSPAQMFTVGPAASQFLVESNGHVKSTQTTPPAFTVNANAGTGATCTGSNATDTAGTINLTTTATAPSSGTQCTVTFTTAYAVAPICVWSPAGSGAVLNEITSGVYMTTTTTTLLVVFANADVTGHTYNFSYHCLETN